MILVDFAQRTKERGSGSWEDESEFASQEPEKRGEKVCSENSPLLDRFDIDEVSRLTRISKRRLRYWARIGLFPPSLTIEGKSYYSFQDLLSIRRAWLLLESGVPFRQMRLAVEALRTKIPGLLRPLAELRIESEGDRLVVWNERRRWEPQSGQLLLDFSLEPLLPPDDPAERRRLAYEAYLEGARLDDDPLTCDQAEAAYRRAIEIDPRFAHAYTNLGNLRFRRGAVDEAIALYHKALAVDPGQPEALHNLGFIAAEEGDHESACAYFRAALASDPSFADARFNLALSLEMLGAYEEASREWRAYLELNPQGNWAEVARRHLAHLESKK